MDLQVTFLVNDVLLFAFSEAAAYASLLFPFDAICAFTADTSLAMMRSNYAINAVDLLAALVVGVQSTSKTGDVSFGKVRGALVTGVVNAREMDAEFGLHSEEVG